MQISFAGKCALVTGAGSGIGEAIALDLARAGATVLAADRDLDKAQDVAARIEAAGGRARAAGGDVVGRTPMLSPAMHNTGCACAQPCVAAWRLHSGARRNSGSIVRSDQQHGWPRH